MKWPELRPQLTSRTLCRMELNFGPLSHWPASLPGVAVQGVVIAGFEQDLILNHHLDVDSIDGQKQVEEIFMSLYPQLSWGEMARLWKSAETLNWFPIASVLIRRGHKLNSHFTSLAECFLRQPLTFQNLCIHKGWGGNDLAPLQSVAGLDLRPLLDKITSSQLSKSQGVQALELAIDLLMQGQLPQEIEQDGEAWLKTLRQLRYPMSTEADELQQTQVQALQKVVPSSTQIRWVRQGDKAGLEVRLFLATPKDLLAHSQALPHIQSALEQGPWKKH